jgi:hypothetical protein
MHTELFGSAGITGLPYAPWPVKALVIFLCALIIASVNGRGKLKSGDLSNFL